MLIGYARVSKEDQDLHLQINALEQLNCNKIFKDKISGTKKNRPGLDEALSYLRKGDVLAVWKLDRLGRSVKALVDLIIDLENKGIQFKSITDNIDTTTTSGRFFFHIMASLAQMERELIAERTRAGLKVARKLGRVGGRPKKMTQNKLQAAKELLKQGMLPKDVALNLEISVPTLYRWIPASEFCLEESING